MPERTMNNDPLQALAIGGGRRFFGADGEGNPVNNVTDHNRWDVDSKRPWLLVSLMDESETRILHEVYIPNRRERPDVVVYEGLIYEVVNTNLSVPKYRLCMADAAVAEIPKGNSDD